MSRNLVPPRFPNPPAQYDQKYFADFMRAFATYQQQVQNAGEGRATNMVMTDAPVVPTNLEDGTMWNNGGFVMLTPATGVYAFAGDINLTGALSVTGAITGGSINTAGAVTGGSLVAPSLTSTGALTLSSTGAASVTTRTNGADRWIIDGAGNAGLGVTPDAWPAGTTAIQTPYGSVNGTTASMRMTQNVWWNRTNYIYQTTGAGTIYAQSDGNHYFNYVPSGTAGTAAALTTAATITPTGRLGINTTGPSARLNVVSGVDDTIIVRIDGADTTTEYLSFGVVAGVAQITAGYTGTGAGLDTALALRTALNGGEGERARLHASGGFSLGSTVDPAAGNLSVTGEMRSANYKDATGGNTALINGITPVDTAGVLSTFNASGSAPVFACRAWVNFNGTVGTGTYTQSGTLITVTITAHGLSSGEIVPLDFTTGTAVDGSYSVTVTGANTFTVTSGVSATTSGAVTRNPYIRAGGNVASISRSSTGVFVLTLSTALQDTYASISGTMGRYSDGVNQPVQGPSCVMLTSSTIEVRTGSNTNALNDWMDCYVQVFR